MKHLAALVLVLVCGCATPGRGLFPPAAGEPVKMVHIINSGVHCDLALAQADLANADIPACRDFPKVDYLEFGWGASEVYRSAEPTCRQGALSLLFPSASVLHVVGTRGALTNAFPTNTILSIQLSVAGFERLRRFIDRYFYRDPSGKLVPVDSGRPGDGIFYRAEGKFCFPRTCNWWVASALSAAGCPVCPLCDSTSSALLSQAKRFGTLIQQR